jgi:cellulose synthase/poly-beta-1,6-N-acetylglucosamine synthase-like glycosyltransferase/FixJ family two-component response regulator
MENTLPAKRLDDIPSAGVAVATEMRRTVLIVDDEEQIRKLVSVALSRANYDVVLASGGYEAMDRIAEAIPDLIVLDIMMPGIDGLALLTQLRADPAIRAVPVIMLTAKGATDDVVAGLGLGADDYLSKPFAMSELVARVRAKVERPAIPYDELPRDRQTGLLTERLFVEELKREGMRVARSGATSCLACLSLNELPRLQGRLGTRVEMEIARQVATLLHDDIRPLDIVGRDAAGRFMLLLPATDPDAARRRLNILSRRIMAHHFLAGGQQLRLTPIIGFDPFSSAVSVDLLRNHVLAALYFANGYLDLLPTRYDPTMDAAWKQAQALTAQRTRWWTLLWARVRFPLQLVLIQVITFVMPFSLYILLAAWGIDITPIVYVAVVLVLLITAILIWIEGVLALYFIDSPKSPGSPYPPATAIIVAYLPNEAATIVESVEACLRMEYAAPLRVILAYNTPRDLPVEEVLRELAQRDSRLLLLRVENSTSKAQNINAALAEVVGEFVALFDADHHPDPDSFTRAWHWLSNGYDVVQGHCVIRNGEQSLLTRMVAVEFEVIYALSHPGRAKLHGFAIFGGTNGFWKTDLLYDTRMRGFMMTEDIDSSMRAIIAGYKIASDPLLISRELAPPTLTALWNQRMRWAQGWFQVSLKHFWDGFRSPRLSLQQKLGFLHLLVWREVYPWLSIQVVPIIAFWALRHGGIQGLNWLVPLFLLTTLFTLTTGPTQAMMVFCVAITEIRRHKWWFAFYIVASFLFYANFRNLIASIAQVKHLMRERNWQITPRTTKKTT